MGAVRMPQAVRAREPDDAPLLELGVQLVQRVDRGEVHLDVRLGVHLEQHLVARAPRRIVACRRMIVALPRGTRRVELRWRGGRLLLWGQVRPNRRHDVTIERNRGGGVTVAFTLPAAPA